MDMEKEKILNNSFIKDYIQTQLNVIIKLYPTIDKKEARKLIKKQVLEKINIPIVDFENNYTGKKKHTNLLVWLNWYYDKKPITTEHGVCFKQHDKALNLSAKMLEYILDTRKYHKNKMYECIEAGDKEGEIFHDTRQKVFKVFANSYYGITGQRQSIFYNLFTALSTTGKGQSLIANAATSFERFLVNNIPFYSYDDLLHYIYNIRNEEYTIPLRKVLSKHISKETLFKYLCNKFDDKNLIIGKELELTKLIETLSQEEIDRIYYKNNLIQFLKQPKIIKIVEKIINGTDTFLDANKIPESIKEDMDYFWNILKEYVAYNYPVFNRIPIIQKLKRATVLAIDTDSNFLNIKPFVDYVQKNIKGYETLNSDSIYKSVNIMANILTRYIDLVHQKYTSDCNVPDDKKYIVNMKNELLLRKILFTCNKKNYASILILKEGKAINPSRLDVKGLTIKKANVNRNVGAYLEKILEEDILKSEKIDSSIVIAKMSKLENKMRKAFKNGDPSYIKPGKCNEIGSYKLPYQQPTVRGVIAWNAIYPEKEIVLPTQVNTIKLKATNLCDLGNLNETHPEIYEVIKDTIFNNKDLSKYGLNIIALPKNEKKIPEWLIPLIDVDTIIADNLSNFLIILNSIGIKTISLRKDEIFYSNIIDL